MSNRLMVFSNLAGRPLAEKVCRLLSIDVGTAHIKTFADQERWVQVEDVRDADVFIICPTQPPMENIMEACQLADAARRASAARVVMVIPYLSYNRQDRKDKPRVALSSKIIINWLSTDIDRALLIDLHSEVTAGFFNRAIVDHLYGSIVSIPVLKDRLNGEPYVIASPDKGGGPRAEAYANRMGQDDYVLFTKRRSGANQIDREKVKIIGDVRDKVVVFVDDMCDTGGTLAADADAAMAAGARRVIAFTTHGLLSGQAIERLRKSSLEELIITDSVTQDARRIKNTRNLRITVVSISELLAKAIRRIHDGDSVSALIV